MMGDKGSRSSKRALGTSQQPGQSDENSEKVVKRSRVSRACDRCRAGRERCDGAHPKCQTCTHQNRECSYNEQPKKRGIQPNYIRTLELTLAWIFQAYPAVESQLASGLPRDDNHAHGLIGGQDPTMTEALHTAWRNCLVNRQIDQMLSGAPIEKDGQSVRGGMDGVENVQVPYSSPPLSAPSENSGTRQVMDESRGVAGPSVPANLGQKATQSTTDMLINGVHQLPDNAWTLLEYYFAFTHAWLPMTEKHSMLKIMYSYPPGGLAYSSITGAEHAELWALMAVAASQVFEEGNEAETRRIRRLAESLVPTGNASYELPHIKAMILLALTDAQEEHILAAWLRIGSVVRLLYLFKLLKKLGQIAKWCRHIHLVAFVVESALALRLKTFSHLRVSFIEAIGFVDEDGIDEWAPWQDPLQTAQQGSIAKAPARSFSTLNELVRICMLCAGRDPTARESNFPDAVVDSSIVFSLLENAASKQDRVQPSNLVAARSRNVQGDYSWPFVGQSEADPSWTSPNLPEWHPNQANEPSSFQPDHPFMSIPNEVNASIDQTSPEVSSSSMLWTPNAAGDPSLQQSNSAAGFADSSVDIFEELATLERQDSTQNPQFMANLGFAPDLDLAEFFGADYQPSDPLLAYLQPTGLGSTQNVTETG